MYFLQKQGEYGFSIDVSIYFLAFFVLKKIISIFQAFEFKNAVHEFINGVDLDY